MKLMDGKAGLVTGAASGIGRAVALAFAAEGARVLVSDIDEANAQTLVEAVADRYGALDWAVITAGLAAPVAPVTERQGEWWTRILAVDLIGVMFGLKHQIARPRGEACPRRPSPSLLPPPGSALLAQDTTRTMFMRYLWYLR